MTRPRIDVSQNVKNAVADMKERLNLKSESEVAAYLVALYNEKYEKLTVKEHEKLLEDAKQLNRQQSF